MACDAVMVDIETFGPAPGGAIVSCGAVSFNYGVTQVLRSFYRNIKAEDRLIDERTVRWWLGTSKPAQEALAKPAPVSLHDFRRALSEFIKSEEPKHVWANGVTFDLAILRDVYGGYPPWTYKQEMCMRPVRTLGAMLGIPWGDLAGVSLGVKHDALDDAIGQALCVQRVFQAAGVGRAA